MRFYSRGSSDYVRDMGWDEELVKESYEWTEKQNAFKPDRLSSWSMAFKNGFLEAGVLPDNGYTLDHLEGSKFSGSSTFDNNGKRHRAADLLKSANPNNIAVLLNATVSTILFDSPASHGKEMGWQISFPRRARSFNWAFGGLKNMTMVKSTATTHLPFREGQLPAL